MATESDRVLEVVLYQPEIPHNTGAIARTCVATNCRLWLVRPLGFRIDDRSMRRSGLDYWDDLDLKVVEDWSEICRQLEQRRFWFFSTKGETVYTRAAFCRGDVLVLGPESRGLPDSLLENHLDQVLKLPMTDHVRSLNLANAASIVVYEGLRQIHSWPGPSSTR